MTISGLSKSLLDAATAILTDGNIQDTKFQQLLEDYGVTSPYELSEASQNQFVVHVERVLGEGFHGVQDLKKRILWRGGIPNLDAVTEAVDAIVGKSNPKKKV